MGGLSAAVLGAAILALVLLVAYVAICRPAWGNVDFWRAHLFEDADQIYARSAGGWDAAAALALRRSQGAARGGSSVADHFRAATIIHRNIVSQEHPTPVGADGAPTAAAREASRLRGEMFDQARAHYAAALDGLAAEPQAAAEDAAAGGAAAAAPGAEAVIEAAIEFAVGGLEALFHNDPLFAAIAGGELLLVPDEALLAAAESRREETVRARQAQAAEATRGQGGARRAEAFLGLSVQHTSDAQNSHDVAVNAAKRALVAQLRREQPPLEELPTLGQVAEALRAEADDLSRDPATGRPRPAQAERALAVVARAEAGDWSQAAEAGDGEVLRRVWARAGHPSNAPKAAALRQAIFDALVDSWEKGLQGDAIQCVDGRISRLLGALTLLDFDEATWGLKRLEQHRNEVFAAAQGAIRAAAEEAVQGHDPELRRVGRAFLASSPEELAAAGTADPAAEASFAASARARIEAVVDAHAAAHPLPPHVAEGLKKEATASLY